MDTPEASSTRAAATTAGAAAARSESPWKAAPPRPAHRHARALRIARDVLLGIVAVLFAIWLVLYITKGRFLKHTFERIVAASTHRTVRVAGDFQLYFDPIDVKFVAEGLTVSNPGWATKPNLFASKRIDTRLSTFPLIVGKKKLQWLDLIDGAIDLEWNKAGQNTWTFGPASTTKGKPLDLPTIRQATVAGTTLRYVDPRMNVSVDLAFQTIKATGLHVDDAIRFTGTGHARGYPFSLNGGLLSPNATIAGGQNRLTLHADAVRTAIDVSGTLPGPTEVEGANLKVSVKGRNLADIFSVAGVAVPETRGYRLSADFTKKGDEYRFTKLVGLYGSSDLAGSLTVTQGQPRLKLAADLVTRRVAIVDIAPFIGYDPDEAAKGKAAVTKQVNGHPQLLPDAPLRVDALKNFDADVHYKVGVITGKNIPVSNIDLTLNLDDSLLKLDPLTFDMARGHVESAIAINARHDPVHTSYDIRLSPTPMGVLLAGYGVDQSGTSGTIKARVKMEGDGDTLHKSLASSNGRIAIIMPKGTFWTRNVQLTELDIGVFLQKLLQKKLKEPVQINCGLIGFTVRDGIAAADPILIDTDKNVMLGRGGFSFKTEAMDLAFRGDAKKFSLFAGQSPIGIDGYFAKPGINVLNPQLFARAGAAVGLGLVATPLASVLAFVDIGDAKSAQCGPILSGADAAAQKTRSGKPRDDVGNGSTAKEENGHASGSEKAEQRRKFND